jgi:uncharacterized protein YbjT (DUF2867 family)
MSGKKVITVLGATGAQGGSVVNHLLKSNKWTVRGITRNPDSEKAQELKKQGVEVVKADLNSKEELVAAFKGAYGAFAVTNYWESGDKEFSQGKAIGEAAKESGIQHLVYRYNS